MIKGAQKQMIVLRTGASRYFDEAYFVLKSGISPGRGERPDLLAEANRILAESESLHSGKRRGRGAWLWFAIGIAVGAVGGMLAAMCLLWL